MSGDVAGPGAGAEAKGVEVSYLEIEVNPQRLDVFERQGDGATQALLEALFKYGLHLVPRVSSPCG